MEGKGQIERECVCVGFLLRSELIIIGVQHAEGVIAITKRECEIFFFNDSLPKDLPPFFYPPLPFF